MDGRGGWLVGLLAVSVPAAGCTAGGQSDRAPAAPPKPPTATRSAAYGIPGLRDRERPAAFRFSAGQGFDTVGVVLGDGVTTNLGR